MTAELIEAARTGDPAQIDRLIAAAWPHAFRIARSVLRDRTLAEDAAQDACAVLYRSIARLRSTQAFTVWFYRIVVRSAAALERRSRCVLLGDAGIDARGLDGSDERLDVIDALAALPRAQRTAIVLRYYAGMTSREIAAVMRAPDSSVRFYLMCARRTLARRLGDQEPPRAALLKEATAGA